MSTDIRDLNAIVKENNGIFHTIKQEIEKVIVGQKSLIDKMLIALLIDGHILLEGLPGLAKTLSILTLSNAIGAQFSRIQFTPDLLPADLTGTMIYDVQKQCFNAKKGPIFSNIVLADEINRAPPKVQAALLEAMGERQVTLGDSSIKLPLPFFVLATQNPIEQEGTYPLPEAQMDRFIMKVVVNYPSKAEEKEVIKRMSSNTKIPKASVVSDIETIQNAKQIIEEIYIDDKVVDYVLDIVDATRHLENYYSDGNCWIDNGASPRATLTFVKAAKANAFLCDRGFVTPHDVKILANDILRHRISLSYEAQAEEISVDKVIDTILDTVKVP